ncbi:DUF4097 family beta strand repeat-containing protein [Streptomyces jumonjinensis]|uniref:DUF4097 family beta strand repeat-containing protein n=1 Tax=Streptomyces jumonjinensis TaxID=1945 RepID=UPI0037AF8B20
MATFDTPEPVSVRIELASGDISIVASERLDTVVTVRPTDGSCAADVKAAAQARIDCSRGRLTVKVPAPPRHRGGMAPGIGSVDLRIEVPEGSQVRVGAPWATIRGEGRLGECRIDTAHGDIRLDHTGPLRLAAARGEISVGRVEGQAKVGNGSGSVRIDEIDGAAVIGNDHGEIRIGEITGRLRMIGMDGDFRVDRPHGSVEVKTAHGSVWIGDVVRGSVAITAASAEIEVGIREGTSARLDVSTVSGSVRNSLKTVDGPAASDEIAEVRARTFSGDIVIRRA